MKITITTLTFFCLFFSGLDLFANQKDQIDLKASSGLFVILGDPCSPYPECLFDDPDGSELPYKMEMPINILFKCEPYPECLIWPPNRSTDSLKE